MVECHPKVPDHLEIGKALGEQQARSQPLVVFGSMIVVKDSRDSPYKERSLIHLPWRTVSNESNVSMRSVNCRSECRTACSIRIELTERASITDFCIVNVA